MSESTRNSLSFESEMEGREAHVMQSRTSPFPADAFLWAAAGSIGLALGLQVTGRRHLGLFVGQWASPLLIFGLYNKLLKLADGNRADNAARVKQWDREAAAETIVEPDAHWSSVLTPVTEDGELPPYREHIENEFGVHSVSDYPHDERFPSSPT